MSKRLSFVNLFGITKILALTYQWSDIQTVEHLDLNLKEFDFENQSLIQCMAAPTGNNGTNSPSYAVYVTSDNVPGKPCFVLFGESKL